MIYVDELIYQRPGGKKFFCHLFADTVEELHSFAEKIGRKRCWYHLSQTKVPHYDLDEVFRNKAIELGAQFISTKEFLKMRRLSKDVDTYLKNNGWSSELFLPHMKHIIGAVNGTDVKMTFGRTVVYVTRPGVMIKAYVHYNGRTREWVTFTDDKGNELESIHYTETPVKMLEKILKLLN